MGLKVDRELVRAQGLFTAGFKAPERERGSEPTFSKAITVARVTDGG